MYWLDTRVFPKLPKQPQLYIIDQINYLFIRYYGFFILYKIFYYHILSIYIFFILLYLFQQIKFSPKTMMLQWPFIEGNHACLTLKSTSQKVTHLTYKSQIQSLILTVTIILGVICVVCSQQRKQIDPVIHVPFENCH